MVSSGMGLTHQQAGIHLGSWPRRVVGFMVVVLGMLVVTAWFVPTSWCWLAWLVVGLAAGAVVGRGRDVWLVALAAVAFYPIAAWLGLPVTTLPGTDVRWEHWAVLNAIGALVVAAGYGVGTLVWWRPGVTADRRSGSRPAGRGEVVGLIALGLLGVVAWVGYSGYLGSTEMVNPAYKAMQHYCATPASAYGWKYQAINYDKADDARLVAANPDTNDCSSQGTAMAGGEVVSKDGTRIAGWYIPAASGSGPKGATLVIVPGWKSNKSEMLKYAPALHDDYNLLILDLRHTGRSGMQNITWGLNERDDVRAMIDWLAQEKHPAWIGSMGVSMGAATALAEAVNDSRVGGLILDSMHANVETSFADGIESERRLPGSPTAWAAVQMASFRDGADLHTMDPVGTIVKATKTPILLLHGTKDIADRPEHSADLNQAAAEKAGVAIERHDCATGKHGQLVDACPAQWKTWVNDFLAPLVARAD